MVLHVNITNWLRYGRFDKVFLHTELKIIRIESRLAIYRHH